MINSLVTQLILSLSGSDWQNNHGKAIIDEIRFSAQCEKMRLTPREKELALMILQGYTNRNISERLFISMNTIRTHLKRINSKAGVENREDLLHYLTGDESKLERV